MVLDLIEKEKQLQTSIERANSPMREIDEVVDSQIQLQGDFKSKGPKFPPQYTTFINRLANQIEKDVEFTNKVNELTQASQIEPIRNIILSEIARQKTQDMSIDSSFFRI